MVSYWLSTPIYTVRIDVEDCYVVRAAPVMKWTKGKHISFVECYFIRRFGSEFKMQRLDKE